MTNSKLATYLQRNAGISHSSTQVMRARRSILWGREQWKQGLPVTAQLLAEQEPAGLLYADTQGSQSQGGCERCQLFKRLISDRGKAQPAEKDLTL